MSPERRFRKSRAAALVGAVGSVALFVAVLLHRSDQPLVGPFSPAALFALGALAALAGASAWLYVMPPRHWEALADRLEAWHEQAAQVQPGRPSWRAAALVGVAAGALAFNLAVHLERNVGPNADEADYLRLAEQLHRAQPRTVWELLVRGEFDEPNRHPLYLALLAYFPKFEEARRVSAVVAVASLAAVAALVARRFGLTAGGLAAVWLATHSGLLTAASTVCCEPLLVLWVTAAWYLAERQAQQARMTASIDGGALQRPQGWNGVEALYPAGVGIALGLAHLTKATGAFLLGLYVLSLYAPRRSPEGGWRLGWWSPGGWRWGWIAAVTFVVVTAPLLIRNVRVYGDPLYSVNTRFLFSDTFDEGTALPFEGTLAAAKRYVATHNSQALLQRATGGLFWECFIWLRVLGPTGLEESRAVVGAGLFALALAGGVGLRRSARVVLALWLVWFLLFFAWYVPIASADRFLLPLVPPVLAYGSVAAVSWMRGTFRERAEGVALAAGAAWAVGWSLVTWFGR